MFDYLNYRLGEKRAIVLSFFLSLSGMIIGKVQFLPLSFDVVLAVLFLLAIGKKIYLLDIESGALKKFTIFLLSWMFIMLISHYLGTGIFALADRRYPLLILSYIPAILGTIMLSEFSVLCCKIKYFGFVKYIGRNSLYLLCVHALDTYYAFAYNISKNLYINAAIRTLEDVLIFLILMRLIKFIKNMRRNRTI